MEPWTLEVSEIADLIRLRQVSPVEITQMYLERIAVLDGYLNAFLELDADRALVHAKQAESEIAGGQYRGALHGIPFALKDMIDAAGLYTTAHSRVLASNIPTKNAAVTQRLVDAGAILLGKLATHEFAHGGPSHDLPWPPARNPWDTDRFTGGSSSGSGAAVAAGLVPVALGTDTGGSVRIPAWLCGIVGFKPTFGRVSRSGTIAYSDSCDHVGPMTWTVRDAAIVLNAIQGQDPDDRTTRSSPPIQFDHLNNSVRGLRLGFVRHFSDRDHASDPEQVAAVDDAIAVFKQLGAEVEDVSMRPLSDYYRLRLLITECDIFALHLQNLQRNPRDYGRHFLTRCLPACVFSGPDYVRAQLERRRVIDESASLFQQFDALITVGAGPAPLITDDRSTGVNMMQTPSAGSLLGSIANLTGVPALAQCCGFSKAGLPLGMQILGRPWEDEIVLRLGHAYETSTLWRQRRPVPAPFRPIPSRPAGNYEPMLVDASLRETVAAAVRHAGLELDPDLFDMVLSAAPSAWELAASIADDHGFTSQSATTFQVERYRGGENAAQA